MSFTRSVANAHAPNRIVGLEWVAQLRDINGSNCTSIIEHMQNIHTLFVNHMDAWGLALIISSTCIVLHDALHMQGILLVLVLTGCYWLGFALNDYYDAPYDAQDANKAPRNYFVSSPLPDATIKAVFVIIILGLFSLFVSFGASGVIVFGIGFFIAWAYSAPPFRLKSRPVLDLATHMLFVETFPYFVCLILLQLTWQPLDTALLCFFVLASLSAQLEQQARDYAVDIQTERNFTTVFGLGVNALLLRGATGTLMLLAALYIVVGAIPAQLIPFGVILLPIFLHRFIRGATEPRSEHLARLTVIAGLLYATGLWGYTILT